VLFRSNPYSTPTISTNLGTVNFAGAAGQGVNVTGNAWSPLGLIINANIGTVPAGGLIVNKTGSGATGMLALGGTGTTQFGNPGTMTDVLDIQGGIVRIDNAAVLNNINARTTVESGATLLSRGVALLGAITLKGGSSLGTTEGNLTIGSQTTTPASLTVVNVAGDTTVYANDYFIQGSNGATITLNAKLTGSGNINLVGPQLSTATGTLQLGNNITGTTGGGNDYSGTITVNTNAILLSQPTATAKSGSELGAATVNLAGGKLDIRDNGTGSSLSLAYPDNLILSNHSFLNVDRIDANANNVVAFPKLTVLSGNQALTVTAGNGYGVSIASLAGPGSLIKAGTGPLTISAFDPSFTGTVTLAGAQGMGTAPLFGGLTIVPTSIPNFEVDGIYHAPATTLAVQNTLTVGGSPVVANGTNSVTVGSNTGALLVFNTANLSTNILVNNGIIGNSPIVNPASPGGPSTLTASQIRGTGVFQTYGQPLTLAGPGNTPVPLNDSATPSALKFAGDNTVNLNPASGGTITGGIEVQSGTLRLAPSAPSANPFGTGTITVRGYPTQSVAPDGIPVSVAAPTLLLDGGANAITHGGDIVNSGLVRVATGSVTVAGEIKGAAVQYVPGLLEGRYSGTNSLDIAATRVANNGTFGIKLEPRGGQTTAVTQSAITGWTDNDLWVYTGQFYDADGRFSFIENIDDRASVWIDGVNVLYNGGQPITSTASTVGQQGAAITAGLNTAAKAGTMDFGMGANSDGWHNIEIRLNNGTGGAGPWNMSNGFAANFGFGLNTDGTRTLDGSLYTRPIDPGDASLLRVPLAAKGNVQVDAGATLNAAKITMTNQLTLAAAAPGAAFNVTSAGSSSVDNIVVTGSSGSAALTGVPGADFTTGNLTVPGGTFLNLNMPGSMTITGNSGGIGTINLAGPTPLIFDSNAAQSCTTVIAGNGSLTKQGTGTLTLATANTYNGSTTISAGTLALGPSGSIAFSPLIFVAKDATFDVSAVTGGYHLFGSPVPQTLKGSGTVAGNVTADLGSFISADSSPISLTGTLTITGGYIATGTLVADLAGLNQGAAVDGYDLIHVLGAATLGGFVDVNLLSGFFPPGFSYFDILIADLGITNLDLSGVSIDFTDASLPVSWAWRADIVSLGGTQEALRLTVLSPEPGSLLLLGGGLLALLRRRRKAR